MVGNTAQQAQLQLLSGASHRQCTYCPLEGAAAQASWLALETYTTVRHPGPVCEKPVTCLWWALPSPDLFLSHMVVPLCLPLRVSHSYGVEPSQRRSHPWDCEVQEALSTVFPC